MNPATSCEDILRRIPDWPTVGSFVEVEWLSRAATVYTRGEWQGRALDSDGALGFTILEYGCYFGRTVSTHKYSAYAVEDRVVRFFHQGCLLAVTCLVAAVPPITKTEERRVIKGLRKIVGAHEQD